MYYCRTLTKDEIKDTYNRYMKKDFPKDELKPLSRILRSLEKEQYICYSIFSGDSLCGYAYIVSLTEAGKTYCLLPLSERRRFSRWRSQARLPW